MRPQCKGDLLLDSTKHRDTSLAICAHWPSESVTMTASNNSTGTVCFVDKAVVPFRLVSLLVINNTRDTTKVTAI